MSLLPNPDNLWLFVGVIAALLVLGCLKTIGFEYYNAVLWHNLKIDVQSLQIDQKRRLKELERAGEAPQSARRRPQPAPTAAPVAEEVTAPPAVEAPEVVEAVEAVEVAQAVEAVEAEPAPAAA
jgi:hypothetical protein